MSTVPSRIELAHRQVAGEAPIGTSTSLPKNFSLNHTPMRLMSLRLSTPTSVSSTLPCEAVALAPRHGEELGDVHGLARDQGVVGLVDERRHDDERNEKR